MKKEVLLGVLIVSVFIVAPMLESCEIEGYVTDGNGDEVENVTVKISVDNPSGIYETRTDGGMLLGYYTRFFDCYPGSSEYSIIAYNSTHYGEDSVIAEGDEKNWVDLVMDQEFPEDENPPKYYNDHDNLVMQDGARSVVEGDNVFTSALWEDESYLDKVYVYSNSTGSYEIDSVCDIANKNVSWCNRSLDTSGHNGDTICWKQYAEDMNENENNTMSEHCFYVGVSFNEDSIELVSPENNKRDVADSVNLKVNVTNPTGDNMDVSFYDISGNSLMKTVEGVSSGSIASYSWGNLEEGTKYEWYVKISDGVKEKYSPRWYFITEGAEEGYKERDKDYILRLTEKDIENRYKGRFYDGFKIVFQLEGNEYNFNVDRVTSESANFSIDNSQYTLRGNDVKKIDLDEDGYYDLKVTSSDLRYFAGGGSLDLEFVLINEEVPAEEEEEKEEDVLDDEPSEPGEKDEDKSYWYLWVLGVVAIGVIAWLVVNNQNNFSKKVSKKRKK